MKKRDFIQFAVLFYSIKPDRQDKNAISWAESMWDRLNQCKYGDAKSTGVQQSANHYTKLQGENKEYFDRFWNAYKDKNGKSGAALSWIKRGDMAKREMEHLVYAAGVFAAERAGIVAQGKTPIMAQGFINQRRDIDTQSVHDQHNKAMNSQLEDEIRTIQLDMVHYQKLFDDTKDKIHYAEVERLKKKLKKTRGLL